VRCTEDKSDAQVEPHALLLLAAASLAKSNVQNHVAVYKLWWGYVRAVGQRHSQRPLETAERPVVHRSHLKSNVRHCVGASALEDVHVPAQDNRVSV
jgi:hypothetical protein